MADADTTTERDAAPSQTSPSPRVGVSPTSQSSESESGGDPGTTATGNEVEAGTTRDGTDVGVNAVGTDGDEPQGPEDALGPGPKRGDYRDRQPEGAVHTRGVPIPDDELGRDEHGNLVEGQPITRMEVQNDHVHNIGDVPGKKGGVHTTLDDEPENAPES
jgi:hypothetical protein